MNVPETRRRLSKSARGLRISDDVSDFDAMAALAFYIVEQIASGNEKKADRVLKEVEDCLGDADAETSKLLSVGLIEDLGNIASHPDTAVSPQQIRDRLGPRTLEVWEIVDAFWQEVAPQKPVLDSEGKALTVEKYESVENLELRRQLQMMHRRTDARTLVGVADVLRYEAATGRGIGHRSKFN
jgi:hypothetical protein